MSYWSPDTGQVTVSRCRDGRLSLLSIHFDTDGNGKARISPIELEGTLFRYESELFTSSAHDIRLYDFLGADVFDGLLVGLSGQNNGGHLLAAVSSGSRGDRPIPVMGMHAFDFGISIGSLSGIFRLWYAPNLDSWYNHVGMGR